MSSDNVPFFDSLSSIYDQSILEQQTQRYKSLYDKFVELYDVPPSHIVRAPGRVNLIVSPSNIVLSNGRANTLIIPISLFFQWP
jgi:Galactokinase galactose-binding signature